MSDTAPVAEAPPKKGGMKKMILIGGLVVAAGGGGAFWWTHSAKAEAKSEHAAPEPVSRGILKFEPFVVNLSGSAGSQFLRTTLQLVVEPAEQATHLSEDSVKMAQLRSALLELLAQQTATSLVTPEGKAAMKAAIISRAQEALDGGKIADVFFSEFVVQF